MKFDSIIIGGGLSGLVAGIGLQLKGRKTLIVSSGQSALHFFSGSFELYNTEKPYSEALKEISRTHPYAKMGADRVLELASTVPDFFSHAGITLNGSAERNHYRLTPMGVVKPACSLWKVISPSLRTANSLIGKSQLQILTDILISTRNS